MVMDLFIVVVLIALAAFVALVVVRGLLLFY